MNKKVIALLVGAIIIIVAGYMLTRWARSSTKEVPIIPVASVTDTKETGISIHNTWFQTMIPSGYKQNKYTETPSELTKVSAVYSSTDYNKGQIAITVKELPPEGLSGVTDYANRLRDTTKYKPTTFGGWPVEATVLVRLDSFETTAFLTHQGLYASVSASGEDNTKTATNIALGQVLDQWNWY